MGNSDINVHNVLMEYYLPHLFTFCLWWLSVEFLQQRQLSLAMIFCDRPNNPPSSSLIPGICEYGTLHGKRGLANVIKVTGPWDEITLEYPSRPNIIIWTPKSREFSPVGVREMWQNEVRDIQYEKDLTCYCFSEDGGNNMTKKMQAALRSWENLTATKKLEASNNTEMDCSSLLNELGSRFCPQRLQEQGYATILTLFFCDTNQLTLILLNFPPKNCEVINECCCKPLNL